MEWGGVSNLTGKEESNEKEFQGTALSLQKNRHSNFKTASSDQNLNDILLQIRSSKYPAVINYGASCCEVKLRGQLTIVLNGVNNPCIRPLSMGQQFSFVVWLTCSSRTCDCYGHIAHIRSRLRDSDTKDIDECPETTQHVRYTPTFHFYRDGERVDEMFGAGEERLHDRLWLQS